MKKPSRADFKLRNKLLKDSGFQDLEPVPDGMLSRRGTSEFPESRPEDYADGLSYYTQACQLLYDADARWPTPRYRQVWEMHAQNGWGRVECEREGVSAREFQRVTKWGRECMKGYGRVGDRGGNCNGSDKLTRGQLYWLNDRNYTTRMTKKLCVVEVLKLANAIVNA